MVEVNARKVFQTTSTRRIDPDYFQKQHLRDEVLISSRSDDFQSFASLGLTVDASAFYPSIEGFYGQGSLPFLRVADVDSLIDFDGCTRIPESLCDIYPTLSRVAAGDIVFTKGGSVARIGLVTKSAAASRDLIFLNSSTLLREDQVFLYLYAQTSFFNRALLRSSSQTAQPHLTVTLVRELSILRASLSFKSRALEVVDAAFLAREQALKYQATAETTLLRALGLENWKASEPLSYIRRSSDVFGAGRLDPEYFQRKYDEYDLAVRSYAFGVTTIGEQFDSINDMADRKKNAYNYIEIGDINVADGTASYNLVSIEKLPANAKHEVRFGDMLISKVRPNRGAVAIINNDLTDLIVSGAFTVLRQKSMSTFSCETLKLLLRTPMYRDWMLKFNVGTHYPVIRDEDILHLPIPMLESALQEEIATVARKSALLKLQSIHRLDAARRAVEIAIEQDEKAAFAYLESNT